MREGRHVAAEHGLVAQGCVGLADRREQPGGGVGGVEGGIRGGRPCVEGGRPSVAT